jgi:hypothetical protein
MALIVAGSPQHAAGLSSLCSFVGVNPIADEPATEYVMSRKSCPLVVMMLK